MAILGVAEAVFGVDDLDACTRFWQDFGLTLVSKDQSESASASRSAITTARASR